MDRLLRIICSFLPTPFCTTIGLMISATYQLLSTNYYITKNKLNMEMKEEREAKASFEKVQRELGNARKSLQEVITEINKILENEEQIMSDIQENSGEGEDL